MVRVYFVPSCPFVCHECRGFPIWCCGVRARIFKTLAQLLPAFMFSYLASGANYFQRWCYWESQWLQWKLRKKSEQKIRRLNSNADKNWPRPFSRAPDTLSKIRMCTCAELGQLSPTTLAATARNRVVRQAVLSSIFYLRSHDSMFRNIIHYNPRTQMESTSTMVCFQNEKFETRVNVKIMPIGFYKDFYCVWVDCRIRGSLFSLASSEKGLSACALVLGE